ncbi:hypothetical protein [Apibacter adventoris]|uniref:Uncharacterized protein n=1 Tax=Apibacter adventoris TaxID=1679466 RepID=A0A2S8AEP8_9FLAO|nr:hypothetical protein [Apibacter adventoris]PQL93989.1 hypothetical protein C4S77_04180 [Apibacter adventoris]
MRQLFIYPLFFLGCLLTYAQDISLIPTVDTLQKLDIQWFKENRSQNNGVVYLEDSTKIKLIQQTNQFRKDIKKKDSPYVLTILYDKSSGEYRGGGVFFYNLRISPWKVYDETGKLKIYKNENQDYPFTYTQVIDKIKKEYHVDLEKEFGKRQFIDLVRGWNKDDPYDYPKYMVSYSLDNMALKNYLPDPRVKEAPESYNYGYNPPQRFIFINGRSGKIELDITTDKYYAAQEYYRNKIQREKIAENSPSKVPNY